MPDSWPSSDRLSPDRVRNSSTSRESYPLIGFLYYLISYTTVHRTAVIFIQCTEISVG